MNRPKVLTLWQPWATLFAFGLKKNETRPKPTSYKGTYLIHAASQMNRLSKEICNEEYFSEALESLGIKSYKDLPCGAIIGAYDHKLCLQVKKYGGNRQGTWNVANISLEEYAFGNYSENRFVWFGENHRALEVPVPYKNGQGYYLNYKGDLQLIQSLITPSVDLFSQA